VDSARSLKIWKPDEPELGHLVGVIGPPKRLTRIIRAGWLIAILAVGLQTAAQLINTFLLAHSRPGLDAAVDRNVFDWMSFCSALVAAFSLLLLAVARWPRRRSDGILAFLVAFLGVDDLTNLHDLLSSKFASALPEPLDRLGDWSTPALYLPLLAVTFGLLWLHGARAAPAPARQIRAALVLLAAAVALRVIVGILEVRGVHASGGIRAIGIAVLEGAELGAWTLLAGALLAEGADLARRANA
jgi:hypothetical protein